MRVGPLLVVALLVAGSALAQALPPPLPGLTDPINGITGLERLQDLASPAWGAVAASCCKQCSKGKACGDSCISRDKSCRKGPGCACDG